MKKIIYKIATLLFLFFVTQVNANQINQINFIGIDFTSEDFLQEIIPFKIGNEFTAVDSQNIIEGLFKTGFFSDITTSTEGDQLNITLIENPFIKYIDFKNKGDTGLSAWLKNEQFYLTEESINALADENNLSPGNIFNKTRFEEFILLLKSKYAQAGYFNIQIKSETSTDLQNRIGIDIIIEQGNQARVDEINIAGNNVFESKEILKLFEIGKPNNFFINYFTNKDLFTENELQSGLDLLTQKYFDSGYLDFKILGLETDLSDNNEKISITIDITEGIQYKVGDISFQGQLGNLTSSFLQESLKIKSGDVFNRQIVISDIQTITDLYADQGYAFVNINPITSDFLDTVNITIDISLNKKVYINRINISGNTRTLDEVIRREIGISEGGLYSRSILRESIMSLRRLGYFSNVQIEANDIPGVSDKIDLFVKVEETKTGAVNFSVSHSNTYGISFGAGIEEKNIFGSGNTLNAQIKVSESFNKISFYFMNPNYNDQDHSISIVSFKSEIDDDDITIN